jgi:Fe-S-cluster containining protein
MSHSRHAGSTNVWSYGCSACGKCCNSAPPLSLPELFYHQHHFIGCLAVRRIRRPRVGVWIGMASERRLAESIDCLSFDELARLLFHRPTNVRDSEFVVLLAAQGLDVPGTHQCPMLRPDSRCQLHADHKPAACAAVPLDPLVPDRWQNLVLAERVRDVGFSGAGCIAKGSGRDLLPLVRDGQVLRSDLLSALGQRRADLANEKRLWGKETYALLERSLTGQPDGLAQIPDNGQLIMSLVPTLLVLAEVSAPCHERCIDFIEAQLALIQRVSIGLTLEELTAQASRSRLLSFSKAYATLQRALRNERRTRTPRSIDPEPAEVEAWLASKSRNEPMRAGARS